MDKDSLFEAFLINYARWEYGIIRPFTHHNRRHGLSLSLDNYYLLHLIDRAGGLTMTEVAHQISAARQQATLKVNRLCEAGYLERQSDENDRRVVKVVVTDRARQEMAEYARGAKDYLEMFHQQLTQQDVDTITSSMEAILAVLEKVGV